VRKCPANKIEYFEKMLFEEIDIQCDCNEQFVQQLMTLTKLNSFLNRDNKLMN